MNTIKEMEAKADGTPVVTVADLRRKYGTKGIGLAVKLFVSHSPEFKGSVEMARVLGEMMADLEKALDTDSWGPGDDMGH